MGRLDLASTISRLETTERKNGEAACRRASVASRVRRRRRRGAEPKPYQPGSMTRACDQENTQGMARRSSMRLEAVREAGRLPIFRSAISRQRGRLAEIVLEVRASRRPGRGRRRRPRALMAASTSANSPSAASASWAKSASRAAAAMVSRLIRPPSGWPYLRRHHLALFGDADAAAHRAGRLGLDGLEAGAAAAADRAAAAVEEAHGRRRAPRPGPAGRSMAVRISQLEVT